MVRDNNWSTEELNSALPATKHLGKNIVIIPISGLTSMIARTLTYANVISTDVRAVHISINQESGRSLAEQWNIQYPGTPLVTLYSPYRMVINPLVDYISELEQQKEPEDYVTVLIPEFETKQWWHRLLHNQTGWILRSLLILHEDVIVTTVPFHLRK